MVMTTSTMMTKQSGKTIECTYHTYFIYVTDEININTDLYRYWSTYCISKTHMYMNDHSNSNVSEIVPERLSNQHNTLQTFTPFILALFMTL